MMMSAMREFDWSYELGMYGGIAAALLACFLTVGGLVLLVKLLLTGERRHKSDRLQPWNRS